MCATEENQEKQRERKQGRDTDMKIGNEIRTPFEALSQLRSLLDQLGVLLNFLVYI